MKYVILGAGGTGGCIGAYLAQNHMDVTLIARGAHLSAIRTHGLCLKSERIGTQTYNIHACTMDEYEGHPDVIFVCVKYYALDDCIDFIRRTADQHTLVIPILNVFGTGQLLQKHCPNCTVLDGCIYIFAMIEAPGTVIQPTSIFKVFYGFRKDQPKLLFDRASAVENDLSTSGIDTFFTPQIEKEALKKFSFVSPMGATGLYHHCTGKDFLTEGAPRQTFTTLISEIKVLGHAMGIDFDEDLIETNLTIMKGLTPDSTTSLQRDIYAHHPSEIDGLIHRVVRLSKDYGLILPTYEKISQWASENHL